MKTKRLTKVQAGRLLYTVLYTPPMPRDDEPTRRMKSKVTSAARSKLNHKHSCEQCEMVMATNFGSRDIFGTLTFRDSIGRLGHLPELPSEPKAAPIESGHPGAEP